MTWLRAIALLAVPRDWRETVRGDLAAELARGDGRRPRRAASPRVRTSPTP
jgi:hypothetical protein